MNIVLELEQLQRTQQKINNYICRVIRLGKTFCLVQISIQKHIQRLCIFQILKKSYLNVYLVNSAIYPFSQEMVRIYLVGKEFVSIWLDVFIVHYTQQEQPMEKSRFQVILKMRISRNQQDVCCCWITHSANWIRIRLT